MNAEVMFSLLLTFIVKQSIVSSFSQTTKSDKGIAMTLIFQEASIGQIGRCPQEEYLLAVNPNNRVIFHKKLGNYKEKKIAFPLVVEFYQCT